MNNLLCLSFEFLSFLDLNKVRSWLYLLGAALTTNTIIIRQVSPLSSILAHYNRVGNPLGKEETFSFIVVGPSLLLELVPQYLEEHGIRI